MGLNNLTNFLNLIDIRRLKTTPEPTDVIPLGTPDRKFDGGYKPTFIQYEDLANSILSKVPPSTDANDQRLEIYGEGDALRLYNGTLNGTPVPDSVIDMNDFTSLYDNHAPTKSGKLDPGAFTGALIKEATVTFSSAFNNANYTPIVTIQSPDNYSATIKNITASSFTISLNSTIAPTVDVYWTAIKHGEY